MSKSHAKWLQSVCDGAQAQLQQGQGGVQTEERFLTRLGEADPTQVDFVTELHVLEYFRFLGQISVSTDGGVESVWWVLQALTSEGGQRLQIRWMEGSASWLR